jgi:hypothetical protein
MRDGAFPARRPSPRLRRASLEAQGISTVSIT